jgi:urea transport system substrate-binding protein
MPLRGIATASMLALASLLAIGGCGSNSGQAPATSESVASTAAPASRPATQLKSGILHSLTGTMAISEVSVKDATMMAIEEINEKGGVLGKKIEAVVEDGASDWPTFKTKAEKLLTQDKVAAVFGCWTSVSRKTVLPTFEEHNGLLWYPVQYEGMETSPNIFYTGATTNQQITPAVEWLLKNGKKKFFLLGSDYVFPRTANAEIKAQLKVRA